MPSSTSSKATTAPPAGFQLPLIYRLFFLFIEPAMAVAGAYIAHAGQTDYLRLTDATTAPDLIPRGTSIVLSQLANMYLFFAINEAFVLRSTGDLRVWKAVIFAMLVGDFGHLYSVREMGLEIYYDVAGWNAVDWGNVPMVYLGAALRIAFLLGVGLPGWSGSGSRSAGPAARKQKK